MVDRINDELIQIKGKLRKKRKWQMQITDYEQELAEIEKSVLDLTQQLEAEAKDVEKLEGLSFTNVIQTLLGKKDEKLEEEKREVVAVQLKLEEAKKTKQEIERELKNVQNELEKLGDVETTYQNLFREKERAIKQRNSSTAATLYQLSEEKGNIKAYLVELDEAVQAGNHVVADLNNAQTSLDSAASWGMFDMFGGGAVSGLVKHSHIDEATEAVHKAQTSMRYFQKELLDVQEELEVHIDISGMLKFADFFLDGFFTDYMVQNKINDSLDQIQDKKSEVKHILSDLRRQMERKEKELEELELERKQFIEKY